jgi:hypothetical protein
MRRIDAFWTSRPDEGLSLADACAKFGCTPEQFARAVAKANHVLGLGVGTEPFYRPGKRSSAIKKPRNGTRGIPIRPDAASSSIFSGQAARVKIGGSGAAGPRIVQRDGDVVRVTSITEQETDEWQERERQRRARQFIPKPKKSARTKSAKLKELIGETDGA